MNRVKGLLMGFALVAGAGIWYACENEGGDHDGKANHNVGYDCLMCHKTGGGGDGVFTAGGTVYIAGTNTGATDASIKLYTTSDGSGNPVVTMTSQVGGNFYSKGTIDFSSALYVKVTSSKGTSSMISPVTTGACNSCHGVSTGKITVQ